MSQIRLTLVVAAMVAALIGGATAWFVAESQLSERSLQSNSSLYSQVRSRGVIRAAYAVGAPLFMIDPNSGQRSGIFYDIMVEAAQRLGLSVEWSAEVGYGEMAEGLRAGRYDIVGSGVWINSSRSRSADFTSPLYYDSVYPYVRVGDHRLDPSLGNLNNPSFTVSTMDGELGAAIAAQDFPEAKRLALPQNADFSQLIANVVSGKADVVFLAQAPAGAYQAVNPNKIEAVKGGKPVRVFPNALMIPSNQYEFKAALDHTILEMENDGTIDRILDRYQQKSGSFLRLAIPYRSADSPR